MTKVWVVANMIIFGLMSVEFSGAPKSIAYCKMIKPPTATDYLIGAILPGFAAGFFVGCTWKIATKSPVFGE